MKKTLIVAVALTTVWSVTSNAKGIMCSTDARPVDGNYNEVRLEQKGSRFDVVHKVITAGFGSPAETHETTLATGLECNIDKLVAWCFKSGSESGESQNSIAEFSLVETTSLDSLEQAKAVKQPPQVHISVGSPLVSELRKKFQFQVKQRWGGCSNL